jgi:hypothetical protein
MALGADHADASVSSSDAYVMIEVPTSFIKLRYDDSRSRSCREDEARFEDS